MLAESIKVAHADVFAFYLKAHFFHWNIETTDFPQYHTFLGDLWEEVFSSVDPLAENIRTLDEYAPGSFKRFSELTNIKDQTGIPPAYAMIKELYADNETVLKSLMTVYDDAERQKEIGVSNFIQGRIEQHKKHAWMLRSIVKKIPV